MRVFMMGINHQVQPVRITVISNTGGPEAFERGQKEHFCEMIRDLIRTRNVEFVAEEARWGDVSNTETVCQELGCRYANIEMPTKERERLKILAGYNENSQVPQEEKARGNRERETYMANQIDSMTQEAKSILVVCGSRHSDSFGRYFRERGDTVEIDDLTNKAWYVEDWQYHMMHL